MTNTAPSDPTFDPDRPAPARVLLRGGTVHSPEEPFATAMLVEDGKVAWLGSDSAADVAHADSVDEIVELDGALVTPAFVDAHVHLTSTGLALAGLDLHDALSLTDALDRIASFAAGLPAGETVIGQGWDESRWPERRAPSPAELDRAVGGRPAYLSRADVHSALVSPALVAAVPEVRGAVGFDAEAGLARQDAHHLVRRAAFALLGPGARGAFQAAALRRAAELGIGALHECGGPDISGEADFLQVLAAGRELGGPEVFGYWGEFGAAAKALELGAVGAGGDLFLDGSIGSHTACLAHAYADKYTLGASYADAEQVAEHVVQCTEAGIQAGFHVIGDGAMATLLDGFDAAAARVGRDALYRIGHRVEHAEMIPAGGIERLLAFGIVASVQPAFDAAWGGEDGMYAARLGAERARAMNPFAAMQRAGVLLAFGSDAPVTALDPWGTVRAAAFHQTPEHRISVRAAFAAHTRGGWRALGGRATASGMLVLGEPATYAVWDVEPEDVIVQAADERLSAWSTDPRAGVPGLPDLSVGRGVPGAVRTVVRGRVVFDGGRVG
ncbi:amidohydrolase [Catenulispora yoronensis]|uniref:Amidohydrolase n=1 Tax=Catenulispora yoronensis TaxID=450799 RepID=A0ABN2VEW4_9ACTN